MDVTKDIPSLNNVYHLACMPDTKIGECPPQPQPSGPPPTSVRQLCATVRVIARGLIVTAVGAAVRSRLTRRGRALRASIDITYAISCGLWSLWFWGGIALCAAPFRRRRPARWQAEGGRGAVKCDLAPDAVIQV